MNLLLLLACGEPECDPGYKFNLDGLCVEDTSAPLDSAEDSPKESPIDDVPEDSDSNHSAPPDDSNPPDDSDSGVPANDWEALGGEPGVSTVLDTFLANVGADPQINWMFANTDLVQLKQLLLEQISEATEGPYTYSGRSMEETHLGMAISEREWGAMVGDLLDAFDALGVPYSADLSGAYAADRLVISLAGMHDDIVTDPANSVLFNQLGGHVNIDTVVTEFLDEVGADSRINTYFAATDMDRLHALLVEQICDATGGYCVYSGMSMQDTHVGMGISDEDFDAMAEDFLQALDNLNIDYTPATFDGSYPADQLITTILSMRNDIVEQ